MFYHQQEFELRCEWGEHGVEVLAPISDVIIIVDVLSFSTSVNIAVERGASVFPYRGNDAGAAEYAASLNAQLADFKRRSNQPSLSPHSLLSLPAGARLVLPSPNGAILALAAGITPVVAGCLRNARAVAQAVQNFGTKVAVIPAGERWREDNGLRPSFEDMLGAGAILSYLTGKLSPEAVSVVAAFQATQPRLAELLLQCSSGKELLERGYVEDVQLAAQLNVSQIVPVLKGGAFVPLEIY